MNNPKAQFQINNGNGWQTIAEADIIDGIVSPPSAWTMARVMHRQIVYVGYTLVETTAVPFQQSTPEPEPSIRYQQIESLLRKNTQLAEVQINAMMTLIIALDNCD